MIKGKHQKSTKHYLKYVLGEGLNYQLNELEACRWPGNEGMPQFSSDDVQKVRQALACDIYRTELIYPLALLCWATTAYHHGRGEKIRIIDLLLAYDGSDKKRFCAFTHFSRRIQTAFEQGYTSPSGATSIKLDGEKGKLLLRDVSFNDGEAYVSVYKVSVYACFFVFLLGVSEVSALLKLIGSDVEFGNGSLYQPRQYVDALTKMMTKVLEVDLAQYRQLTTHAQEKFYIISRWLDDIDIEPDDIRDEHVLAFWQTFSVKTAENNDRDFRRYGTVVNDFLNYIQSLVYAEHFEQMHVMADSADGLINESYLASAVADDLLGVGVPTMIQCHHFFAAAGMTQQNEVDLTLPSLESKQVNYFSEMEMNVLRESVRFGLVERVLPYSFARKVVMSPWQNKFSNDGVESWRNPDKWLHPAQWSPCLDYERHLHYLQMLIERISQVSQAIAYLLVEYKEYTEDLPQLIETLVTELEELSPEKFEQRLSHARKAFNNLKRKGFNAKSGGFKPELLGQMSEALMTFSFSAQPLNKTNKTQSRVFNSERKLTDAYLSDVDTFKKHFETLYLAGEK